LDNGDKNAEGKQAEKHGLFALLDLRSEEDREGEKHAVLFF
jgi:hypothetical protein